MFDGWKEMGGRRHSKNNLQNSDNRKMDSMTLTEGLTICPDQLPKEKRLETLFVKGFVVYLLVMGVMGAYLSSLNVEFSWPVMHILVLLCSLYCASLYYSNLWQNTGYLLLLAGIAAGGYFLGKYINSGFYSVANDMSEAASEFFQSNAMRSYGEQIGNRYAAITISMSYIGCICCVLVNIMVSRKMRCGMVVLLEAGALAMPLYLEKEPSFLYMVMNLAGILVCFMIRGNGHYRLTFQNNAYEWDDRKKRFVYVYDVRSMARTVLSVIVLCIVVLGAGSVIYPGALHKSVRGTSNLKKRTMETAKNVSMLGLAGLFNFYPNTGGLTNGTLGGVNAVRYDYETDLTIRFAPYTQNRIYLKTFTGCDYLPYNNRWRRQTDSYGNQVPEQSDTTTALMKKNYQKHKKKTGKGHIFVKNVAAASGVYLPYYSEEINKEIFPGTQQEYTFYPSLSGKAIGVTEAARQEAQADWLNISEENQAEIEKLCQEAGLSPEDSVPNNVQKLAQYFQENIPYSYRPGATPYRADFINYFLGKNRRGYCAHFASAATLAFRYIGIPARYVEGYGIDPEDIAEEGTIQYEQKYQDYYEGYSEVGKTAVVSVNVTDASAHAWVEVFDPDMGWQVADVTPSTGEEPDDNGLWQRIIHFLGGRNSSGNDLKNGNDSQIDNGAVEQVKRTTGYISAGVVVAILVWFVIWRLRRYAVWWIRFWKSGRNDRLIMEYQRYLRKVSQKQDSLKEYKNYKEQLNWLNNHGYWCSDVVRLEKAVSILERAGFSNVEVTAEEYELMRKCFHRNKRAAGKVSGRKRG